MQETKAKKIRWSRVAVVFLKVVAYVSALALVFAVPAALLFSVPVLETFSVAIFIGGLLLIVASMVSGLVSAPPRILSWLPIGSREKRTARKDRLEPSQEQFVFTLLLFGIGVLLIGLSVLLTYVAPAP